MSTENSPCTPISGLELAIESVGGNASELARRLRIRPQSLYNWVRRTGGKIPLERVPDVSKASGVPPHKLRPDLPEFFPPPGRCEGGRE